ncbi:hypothetical protein BDB00DRAFT_868903 [Zychaea mexicana]|uniref:uncharacterized protein n=1 Tax=Zychaea mexicana TaxID=64656 RepID=UPI0022FE7C53|nr:uncharacterized protein BDB00DRAFT_868903 [Zychaea mexicana]KAI9497065.1 hypothetical protein BDB00DRAFT_868903 [Zychaea mexicana]
MSPHHGRLQERLPSLRVEQLVLVRIMDNNSLVDDATLVSALGLREATSAVVPRNTTILYLRSWTITPATFQGILARLSEDDEEFLKTDIWAELAALHQDQPMYFRYVGVHTTGDRHERLSNTRIYEIHRGTRSREALNERIAIGFSEIDNLLNVQYGGFDNAYVPGPPVFHEYSTFAITFHEDLKISNSRSFRRNLLDFWGQLIVQEVQRLAASNRRMKLAKLYSSRQTFFADSRAGRLTRQILARQKAWSSDSRDAALQQLAHHMSIIQPLVTVTFSRGVTSVAFGNFLHDCGILNQRNDSFVDYVGIPRLCHMLNDDWLTNSVALSDNQLTTVIPHINPSFEELGAFPTDLNTQLLDLTWIITLVISGLTIKYATRMKSCTRDQVIQRL